MDIDQLLDEMHEELGIHFRITERLKAATTSFLIRMSYCKPFSKTKRRNLIVPIVKRKLKLEASNRKIFIDKCASENIYFNYIEKLSIENAFNSSDQKRLREIIGKRFNSKLAPNFLTKDEVIEELVEQIERPINKRTKKVDQNLSQLLCDSIASAYFVSIYERRDSQSCFSTITCEDSNYWSWLHKDFGRDFNRNHALSLVHVDAKGFKGDYEKDRDAILSTCKSIYEKQNNHSYLFVWVDSAVSQKWELASDLSLYLERFKTDLTRNNYFRCEAIEKETLEFMGVDKIEGSDFGAMDSGFFYKDTFCIYKDQNSQPSLLLSFRKDEPENVPIPCPTCRSIDVQPNSYPSLGIRSWECRNLLCSDRSMSNRGKRYSYDSLLKHAALSKPECEIPKKIINDWQRDVVVGKNYEDALKYIFHCYSMFGDQAHFYGGRSEAENFLDRKVKNHSINSKFENLWHQFESKGFFKRWNLAAKTNQKKAAPFGKVDINPNVSLYTGDAEEILSNQALVETIDGAVTSPPYFNAREYSQYPNLYCYMNKMHAISSKVFQVLKPGSYYLYNIFDYFDNERTVAFSAMGKKRLTISSSTVYAFRKIGFELIDNIVWDKGAIEGKRGFNAGNNSPYYQAPFNCWEHILVFRKPSDSAGLEFPSLFQQSPVFKIVGGKNIYGHTAPFPPELPNLLLKRLSGEKCVLDPFAGSGTTAEASMDCGHNTVLCEYDDEYSSLIVERLRNRKVQRDLF